jgi:lysophospholipase L1-like esterase
MRSLLPMRISFVPFVSMMVVCAIVISDAQRAGSSHSSAPFESEILAYEKRDLTSQPPRGAFLFIGSSSIRMWNDLETVFLPKPVINRGFGGSEIRDSTFFADRIVVPYQPRMVLLYAGDNDIAAGRTADDVLEDFKQFVGKVRERLPDTKIGFISIKPSPSRWAVVDVVKDANKKIREYMRKQKRMAYIDVFSAMLGPDGQPKPELYKEDKLHPTAECYILWKKIIGSYLK